MRLPCPFPPPALTLQWFSVTWNRVDVWRALTLSVQVASVATTVALVLGTLAAAAVYRSKFFGLEAISFLLVLPIALPGIVTGIALRSAMGLMEIPFSFWTIVIGHATRCALSVLRFRQGKWRSIEIEPGRASPVSGGDAPGAS